MYASGTPASVGGVAAFAGATGAKPDVVMYYSGWFVPFPAAFAATVASNGAVPLVPMDPDRLGVAGIAAGRYDGYLSAYAEAVRAYRHPVIVSFGHEMNGSWSSWGYRHTSPASFVAAWRHIVTLFRELGAGNVTWLWTVNIINNTEQGGIPPPAPWWPGSSYVTWVGIDGYYLKPNWQFAPLFGPTIASIHALTRGPDPHRRTGATLTASQPAKSPACAPAFTPMACSGSYGSMPGTPSGRTSPSAVPRRRPRSAPAPARSAGPDRQRLPGCARQRTDGAPLTPIASAGPAGPHRTGAGPRARRPAPGGAGGGGRHQRAGHHPRHADGSGHMGPETGRGPA